MGKDDYVAVDNPDKDEGRRQPRKKLVWRQDQGRNIEFLFAKGFLKVVAHCPIPNHFFFRETD